MKPHPTSQSDPPAKPRALIDASSAILLGKAGLIHACCEVYTLLVTRSVLNEISAPLHSDSAGLHAMASIQPGFIVLPDPAQDLPKGDATDLARLHRGERDTVHHFLCGAAQFVIMDDGPGLQVCRRRAIPHVNALLCPRLLYYCGYMTDPGLVDVCMDRLVRLGRYSAWVVDWARNCRRSDLAFFVS